jgi:hypothetical protein
MINKIIYIKVSILLLGILVIPTLIGCTPSASPVQPSLTFEALTEESPTAEDTSIPTTHTPGDTSNPTNTLTTCPTIDIQALLSKLSIDESRLQFAAIKRACQVPETFKLRELDPACFFAGIEQGEFRNFSSITQYDRMRIEYALLDGVMVPKPFLEHTILVVYQHQQDGEYSDSVPLYEVPLLIDEEQPDSFFGDLDLIALAKTQLIAFHVVLQGYGDLEYRADQILFYQAGRATATNSGVQQGEDPIADTATFTPQPSATQPPPTATEIPPTATQPPPPTATQPPPPTSTPLPTKPPAPSPTPTREFG